MVAVMDETVRLRVLFEDRHLLTKLQRSEGLKRCWILLKPEFKSISHLASHLIFVFDLFNACPNGILIYMDGFVLPPFASTRLFKDKDIISVKRKEGTATDIVRIGDEANSLEDSEAVERRPVLTGVKLLALEEFEKETGGYQSELEEIEYDSPENTLHLETPSSGKTTSKKRKSSKKLNSSRRKKIKPTCSENLTEVPVNGLENDVHLKDQPSHHKGVLSKKSLHKDKSSKDRVKLKKASNAEVGNRNEDNVEHIPTKERCDNLQENGEAIEDVVPEGTKKGPSRSARRKKAKRKWLKELNNSQKKELIQSIPDKVVCNKSQEHQESEEKTDTEAEIVPIVVRPGHIRFEPLDKDHVIQQTHDPMENFQWNGITSKRKGQKWGMEKASGSWSNGHENFGEDPTETENFQWNGNTTKRKRQKWAIENTSTSKSIGDEDSREDSNEKQNVEESEKLNVVHDPVDFEKLNPLSCLPKDGDVVAYRLVELSSTWCPELSAFRVGKVSWFDSTSNVVMLVPVPDYPIVSDEKRDEEGTTLESDASLYFEDGSLEIDFASLVDVRIFNHDNSNPDTVATGGSKEAPVSNKEAPVSGKEAASCVEASDKNEVTHVKSTENGGSVDVWEEISQVLSEKKMQLSKEKEDSWSQKESSGKSQWSYKALRSSALGPIMARLRSGNDL